MSLIIILDTIISDKKEFKLALEAIFGFSWVQLRNLNKILGVNTRSIYNFQNLDATERSLIASYLPDLNLFGSDLKKKISSEREKYFSIKCYRKNRFLLGLPANGQRTHTNGKTAKRLKFRY